MADDVSAGTEADNRRLRDKQRAAAGDKNAVTEGMNKDLGAIARAAAAKRAAAAGKEIGSKGDVDFGNLGKVAPGSKRMGGRR
jgi:hypothetical protein